MSRFSLFGFDLPEDEVRAVDDGTVVMQDDGEPIQRWRTESLPPPVTRCRCSHEKRHHVWGVELCMTAACGCRWFRPKDADA